jgi:cytochrome c-type biogenesis protein CcsB
MKFSLNAFLSMRVAMILIGVIAVVLAVATFIENDFGPEAAREVIYHATWFEALGILLGVLLVVNLVRRRLWRKGKKPVLVFHAAVLLIGLGYLITRYIGFEGVLHLREGETSGVIMSGETYLRIQVEQEGEQINRNRPVTFTPITFDRFRESIPLGEKDLIVRPLDFFPNGSMSVVPDPGGFPVLSLSVMGIPQPVVMTRGETRTISGVTVGFDTEVSGVSDILLIRIRGQELELFSHGEIKAAAMTSESQVSLPTSTWHPLESRIVYFAGDMAFSLKSFLTQGVFRKATEGEILERSLQEAEQPDILVVGVEYGDAYRVLPLYNPKDSFPETREWDLNGIRLRLAYGYKPVQLPFSLTLTDFTVGRYSGSRRPSGFSSDVVVRDPDRGVEKPFKIYMNHILQYRGFRFYQSSYDEDEKGSILSVSHDPGTWPTYAGYLLLIVALITGLFMPEGRFRSLGRKLSGKGAARILLLSLSIMGLMGPAGVKAQGRLQSAFVRMAGYPSEHCRRLGRILIQDREGRIKPLNSWAVEKLRQVSRTDRIPGIDPDRWVLLLLTEKNTAAGLPLVRITHPGLAGLLGFEPERRWASLRDFYYPSTGQYILGPPISRLRERPARFLSREDRCLMDLHQRGMVLSGAVRGGEFRIFPLQDDSTGRWIAADPEMGPESDYPEAQVLLNAYVSAVHQALSTGRWDAADQALEDIRAYQKDRGGSAVPSENRIRTEIAYNRARIFQRLIPVIFLSGLALLAVFVAGIFHSARYWIVTKRIFVIVLTAGLAVYTFGLILRWIVSGHAPWSNKYESMIYIGWATLLAGILFSGRSVLPVASAGLLSALILRVAHMPWMDPKITLLPPVLKSHWLVIHVSVITSSYGFLGVGAASAFFILILLIFANPANREKTALVQRLSRINERVLIVGLVLVTAGNLFGAVWANESWGRYWGWDPKETWTLIIILAYTVVLHLRLIPGLNYPFYLNTGALLAFSTVLMTYFGVNFYLSGLHSYAQGDPVPVPLFVYILAIVFFWIIVFALRNRNLKGDNTQ